MVISPAVQQRLDAGNDFGDKSMALFGDYEEIADKKPQRIDEIGAADTVEPKF